MFKASEVLTAQYSGADLGTLQRAITDNYLVDEDAYLHELMQLVPNDDATLDAVTERSAQLVKTVRERADGGGVGLLR